MSVFPSNFASSVEKPSPTTTRTSRPLYVILAYLAANQAQLLEFELLSIPSSGVPSFPYSQSTLISL